MKKTADIFMRVALTIFVAVICVAGLAMVTEANSDARFVVAVLFGLIFVEFGWSIWKKLEGY